MGLNRRESLVMQHPRGNPQSREAPESHEQVGESWAHFYHLVMMNNAQRNGKLIWRIGSGSTVVGPLSFKGIYNFNAAMGKIRHIPICQRQPIISRLLNTLQFGRFAKQLAIFEILHQKENG